MKKKSAVKKGAKKSTVKKSSPKSKDNKFAVYAIAAIALALIFIYLFAGSSSNVAVFETNYGIIEIELYDDMPITTENFKQLIENGIYNGVIFHRIISNFMIQGGDPTGTGYGDPSIASIKDEFTHEGGNKNNYGTISMANSGPNTGSSQFFINTNKAGNNFLDTKHPAFGKVVSGMDVVLIIEGVRVGALDRPVEDVVILKAWIK